MTDFADSIANLSLPKIRAARENRGIIQCDACHPARVRNIRQHKSKRRLHPPVAETLREMPVLTVVCTENLDPDIMMMKSTKDRV